MTARSGQVRRIVAADSPARSKSARYSGIVRAARTDIGPSTLATRDEQSTAVPITASASPMRLRIKSEITTPTRAAVAM
jgi:hypothetical protein